MRHLILFLLMGCPVLAAMAQVTSPMSFNSGSAGASPMSAAPQANAGTSFGPGIMGGFVQDANYKLRVGDTVSFQIKEDIIWKPTDEPTPLIVTDSGEVDVPYIGRVSAVDKTCPQLAAEIRTNLEATYYNKATVVVSLNKANGLLGRVFIMGAVRSQGPIDMQVNENLTAGQAIMRAGGLGDFAKKTAVRLVRANPLPTEDKVIELDMEQILDKGHTEKDTVLRPGDFLIVPSKFFNF